MVRDEYGSFEKPLWWTFHFQVESTDWTVQHKFNAQFLRLFGLHRDVNDAHRAGAIRLQNKTKIESVRLREEAAARCTAKMKRRVLRR